MRIRTSHMLIACICLTFILTSITFSQWSLTGNAGTTPGTNYAGTSDAKDFVIKSNGTERMRFLSGGKVGIGTSTPVTDFQVNGILEGTGLNIGTDPHTSYPIYFEGNTTTMGFPLVFVQENTPATGTNSTTYAMYLQNLGGSASGNNAVGIYVNNNAETRQGGKNWAGDFVVGADSGTNYGVSGSASGLNATNYGGYFGAGSSSTSTSYGVYITSPTAGTNHYALYSNASAVSYINGAVGIGTTTLDTFKLAVCGSIHAKAQVLATGWCDFVFDKNYNLMPLEEVEKHIKTDKHLPGIPTTKQVVKNGLNVGQMQVKMMQKIEELTLYLIDLKKENEALKVRMASIENK